MKQRQVGSISVLTPHGYLTGGEETDELERGIAKLSEAGGKHLVINLSEAQHLNSTALGVLIRGYANYRGRGGEIKLCGLGKRIKDLFTMTKLIMVFDHHDTEDEAIAAFAE
jgi:anti-sigma B factor antagonist